MNNSNKTLAIVLFIFGMIFLLVGSTFAYFAASIEGNGDDIGGTTLVFDANMTITTEKSGNLIPVADNLIDDTLNSTHVCTDTRGYGLCSLYKLTLVNNGDAVVMTGYLKTLNTTYTTNNLKYQLFTKSNNTYTAASDMNSVPAVNAISSFTLNNADISVSLNSTNNTADYYLALWLSDPGNNQLVDSNKTYNGSVVFGSSTGNSVSADFS